MSSWVSVQARGTIALPADVRRRFHLDQPGAQVEVLIEDDRVVLRPMLPHPASQQWFWDDTWQQGERQADVEGGTGAGTVFENDDDFVASLAD